MEIKEIFDTIESDSNMDKDLQNNILESLNNIANADKLVDGLEEKIEEHRHELSEKELKYIINKCISYKSVFYKFRNGGIVDFDQLNEITKRIFELERSIRQNDFTVWKEELLAYKGSKEDKAEEKMLKSMLMVVPEESNIVEKITRMFRRTLWKVQQKAKQAKKSKEEVIELPSTGSGIIDLELPDEFKEEKIGELVGDDIADTPTDVEVKEVEELEKLQEFFEEEVEEVKEEKVKEVAQVETTEVPEEIVEEPKVEDTKEAETIEQPEEVVTEEKVEEKKEETVEEKTEETTEEEQPKTRRGARKGSRAE